jgi:hypothetical protein
MVQRHSSVLSRRLHIDPSWLWKTGNSMLGRILTLDDADPESLPHRPGGWQI